jgi:hypothetical protein
MEIGSLNKARAALAGNRLEDEERIILAKLIAAGYGEDGRPLGHEGRLSSDELARVIYPTLWPAESPSWNEEQRRIEHCKRQVRRIVNALIIRHGVSIMCQAGNGGGYYLPASKEEVERNHQAFHRRAMTGLVKDARGTKAAYADAMVQLTLGFEGEAKAYRDSVGLPDADEDGPPAWVAVVTQLLQQVKGDPVKYASEIKRIQEECGDIFVRRDKLAKIRQLSGELNEVLEGLQG